MKNRMMSYFWFTYSLSCLKMKMYKPLSGKISSPFMYIGKLTMPYFQNKIGNRRTRKMENLLELRMMRKQSKKATLLVILSQIKCQHYDRTDVVEILVNLFHSLVISYDFVSLFTMSIITCGAFLKLIWVWTESVNFKKR